MGKKSVVYVHIFECMGISYTFGPKSLFQYQALKALNPSRTVSLFRVHLER